MAAVMDRQTIGREERFRAHVEAIPEVIGLAVGNSLAGLLPLADGL